MRVALDAMGGDHAPAATVRGALRAADEHGVDVVLVGVVTALTAELEAAGRRGDALPIVPADEAIAMGEDPALALRAKPNASIRVAAALMADGKAAALVSAGSTGATLAAALLTVGRVPGVRRPVVGAVLPVGDHGVVLVDAGASLDAPAEAVAAAACMGVAYARVLGVTAPRVGLLNVGAEPGKGNALAKQSHALLLDVPGFVGNVEPALVLAGGVDVVATDGFTGNVFLKTVEALGRSDSHGPGAAALLGIAGDVLVAHGAADEHAIAAALRTAAAVASAGLARSIAAWLGQTGADE